MTLEDSMLGGKEDNLHDLLAECGDQIDRPAMRVRHSGGPNDPVPATRTPTEPTGSTTRTVLSSASQAAVDEEERDQTRQAAVTPNPYKSASRVDQLASMVEVLVNVVKRQQEERKRNEDGRVKRKDKDDVNYQPQEPVLLLEESYRIEDDAHERVDTRLRQRLRPINADPEKYWKKDSFARVERPILGSSLYLEHITPGK